MQSGGRAIDLNGRLRLGRASRLPNEAMPKKLRTVGALARRLSVYGSKINYRGRLRKLAGLNIANFPGLIRQFARPCSGRRENEEALRCREASSRRANRSFLLAQGRYA